MTTVYRLSVAQMERLGPEKWEQYTDELIRKLERCIQAETKNVRPWNDKTFTKWLSSHQSKRSSV